MMQIDILDQTETLTTEQFNLLEAVLTHAAVSESVPSDAELSVSIVDNKTIQTMNETYRNKNVPTDVLSFQMDDITAQELHQRPLLLGDIIISHDKVLEQKERFNHSFERELVFLAVHGFLHLIGYTHDNDEDEALMFRKQKMILEAYNVEK